MVTLDSLIRKRINGVITILKNIEKTQTKPTAGMLSALLEQAEPKKKPLLIDRKRINPDGSIKPIEPRYSFPKKQ